MKPSALTVSYSSRALIGSIPGAGRAGNLEAVDDLPLPPSEVTGTVQPGTPRAVGHDTGGDPLASGCRSRSTCGRRSVRGGGRGSATRSMI